MACSVVRTLFAGIVASTAMCAVAAVADPVADFYRGRTVAFVVAGSAEGGYAAYSRLVADHLSRFLPGNPKIELRYAPGAGGAKGANLVYNGVAKDGSAIGMPVNSVALYQLLRPRAVQYDAAKFAWLGGVSTLNSVLAVWHTSPAITLDALRKKSVTVGATAKAGDSYQQSMLIRGLLGLKLKVVAGYRGSRDLDLAMASGETQGRVGSWESWRSARGDWIDGRKIVPVLQIGPRRIDGLTGVPQLIDLVATEDDKSVVRLLHASAAIGRSVYGPPEIPADRRAALRKAVDSMCADGEFRAAAKARQVALTVTPGAEIEAMVAAVLKSPREAIVRYKKAVKFN